MDKRDPGVIRDFIRELIHTLILNFIAAVPARTEISANTKTTICLFRVKPTFCGARGRIQPAERQGAAISVNSCALRAYVSKYVVHAAFS